VVTIKKKIQAEIEFMAAKLYGRTISYKVYLKIMLHAIELNKKGVKAKDIVLSKNDGT